MTREELQEFQEAFDIYADADGNLPAEDLLRCLQELALAGRSRHEKWSLDKLCNELYQSMVEEGKCDIQRLASKGAGSNNWSLAGVSLSPPQHLHPRGVEGDLSRGTSFGGAASDAADGQLEAGESRATPDRSLSSASPEAPEADDEGAIIETALVAVEKAQQAGRSPHSIFRLSNTSDMSPIQSIGSVASEKRSGTDSEGPVQDDELLPISFEDFIGEIVPAVRKHIHAMRKEAHFSAFLQILEKNSGKSIFLTPEEFKTLAAEMDLDEELAEAALEQAREEEASIAAGEGAGSPAAKTGGGSEALEGLALDGDSVHDMLLQIEERMERRRRREERDIKRRVWLDDEMFWRHRSDLLMLYTTFHTYDDDEDECLRPQEAKLLLKHIGFQPYRPGPEAEYVERLLAEADKDGNGLIDFIEFLCLVDRVRVDRRARRRDKLEKKFRGRDLDGRGRISIEDGKRVLREIGICWRGVDCDSFIDRLVDLFDIDAVGDFGLSDMQDLAQLAEERVQRLRADGILGFVGDLGMSMKVFAENQAAFDKMEQQLGRGLSSDEVKRAIQRQMHRQVTDEEIQDLFGSASIRPDVRVDIKLFLRLMHNAVHVKRLFALDDAFTLGHIPEDVLRECLLCFHVSEAYLNKISRQELVELLASFLEIAPKANLREECEEKINNARQLYTFCCQKCGTAEDEDALSMGVRRSGVAVAFGLKSSLE